MSTLRAGGYRPPKGCGSVKLLRAIATQDPMGIDEHLGKLLDLCEDPTGSERTEQEIARRDISHALTLTTHHGRKRKANLSQRRATSNLLCDILRLRPPNLLFNSSFDLA